MTNSSFVNKLLADILKNVNGKHCRICLKDIISPESLSFEDMVAKEECELYEVKQLMCDVLGPEALTMLPGLMEVCMDCIQALMECHSFILKYRNTNKLLNDVLDNALDTICNVENDSLDDNQMLFLVADPCDSKAVLTARADRYEEVKSHLRCKKCDRECYSEKDYEEHRRFVHGVLPCEICQQTYLEEEELEKHMREMHTYQCNECMKVLHSKRAMVSHLHKKHRSAKYICKRCGLMCPTVNKLILHESSHSKMECPKCSKTYLTVGSYTKHQNLCLSGLYDPQPYRSRLKQSHICVECGKGYSTPGGLRVHERFTHENEIPHRCPHCPKAFTAPSYLKAHLITHTGEKNFNCTLCNKNFVTKEALLYHTRRHTGEKPYSCKHCDEKFVNSSARAEHIKYKHSQPTLKCSICSRMFVTKFFLRKHFAKHFDPSSKLFNRSGPADVPSVENRRAKIEPYPLIELKT